MFVISLSVIRSPISVVARIGRRDEGVQMVEAGGRKRENWIKEKERDEVSVG